MLAYILHRLLAALPTLIAISIVSFALILLHTCSQDFLPDNWVWAKLLRHF